MLFPKLALIAIVAGEFSTVAISSDDTDSCASSPQEEASLGNHALLQQSSGTALAVSVGLHTNFENDRVNALDKMQGEAERAAADVARHAAPPAGPGAGADAGAPAAKAAPAAVADPPVPAQPVAAAAPAAVEAAKQSFVADKAFDQTNVEEFMTSCEAITPEAQAALAKEIKDYEADVRFQMKIREAKGEIEATAGHKSIVKYLREHVLEPDWSILELGCAAGGILRYVDDVYPKYKIGSHGSLVGVELVTGWVEFAKEYYPSQKKPINIYEGDITDFTLPEPYAGSTFDFVMLNDVMEHIQNKRYGCFFNQLDKVTHDGSIVYMHTPSPKAQLLDKDQYYENVVPHHLVVSGMAMIGFELVKFEYDIDTQCGGTKDAKLPRQLKGAGCYFNGWPKYTHNVYRKTEEKGVLNVS